MEYMFSISFRKHRDEKKENNLFTLIIKMYILFARSITMSTARESSVSPSSYTNTIFNPAISARAFLGLFSKWTFCNKRSHGTKSAILEGKLIIIPALEH